MASFEEEFKTASNPGPGRKFPGAVLLAADRSGEIRYRNEQGFTSLEEDIAKPLTADTILWIASCSKLMTTISVLQCVERGLLSLDEDVTKVLPEIKSLKILTGFNKETGEPILKPVTKTITLRHFLTHSSGMGYDFTSTKLMKWKQHVHAGDIPIRKGDILLEYTMPLLFEPGQGWAYSCAIDWAGKMVERVNNGMRLGEYMKQNIWKPLGMDSTTFHPFDDAWVQPRLCSATARLPSGELVAAPYLRKGEFVDDCGGGGVFSTPSDYMKLLVAVLQNNGTLMRPETMEMMFQPQLSDPSYLVKHIAGQTGDMYRGGMPDGDVWNYGLGAILNTEDVEGICKKGTLSWSGLPNLYWWIDPKLGNCGLYASQLLPPEDQLSMKMSISFRKEMYKKWSSQSSSKI